MATTKPKKKTQPYVPSYANGGIQYTGSGATPAGKKSPSGTQVTSIRKSSDNSLVPAVKNMDGYEVTRDATGLTGVSFKDGRSFMGLNTQQVNQLIKEYKNRPLTVDEQREQEQAQWQEELDKANRKNSFIESKTPKDSRLETLGQVDVSQEEFLSNPETQNIIANVVDRAKVDAAKNALLTGTSPTDFIDPETGQAYDVPLSRSLGLNKLTGLIPSKGGFKKTVMDALSETEEGRRYLEDYSNERNFESIKTNIQLADDKISVSKELASNPETTEVAYAKYQEAIKQKRIALAQLKYIASYDQRAYVDDVKDKMTELQTYFDDLQQADDEEMKAKLRKSQIQKIINGGVQ